MLHSSYARRRDVALLSEAWSACVPRINSQSSVLHYLTYRLFIRAVRCVTRFGLEHLYISRINSLSSMLHYLTYVTPDLISSVVLGLSDVSVSLSDVSQVTLSDVLTVGSCIVCRFIVRRLGSGVIRRPGSCLSLIHISEPTRRS